MLPCSVSLLKSLGLVDPDGSVADLSKLDDPTLLSLLAYYRRSRAEAFNARMQRGEPAGECGMLSALVSSISAQNSIASILPAAFVYSRIIVNDPLVTLAKDGDAASDFLNVAIGAGCNQSTIDRRAVENAIMYLMRMSPLVNNGLAACIPLTVLHETPKNIPVFYSEDGFKSAIPEHVYSLVQSKTTVLCGLRDQSTGEMIFPKIPLKRRTPAILVAFPDDSAKPSMYFLSDIEEFAVAGNSSFRMRQRINWDKEVEESQFKGWVHQSINRSVLRRASEIEKEVAVASKCGAVYLTESQFEANLLSHSARGGSQDLSAQNAVNFLKANLPYLQIGSPEDVARIRSSQPQLFQRFQESLIDVCSNLNAVEVDFEFRAQQLFRKEIAPQVHELENAFYKASRSIAGAGLAAFLPIGLALFRPPEIPIVAALGLWAAGTMGSALPNLSDYLNSRRGPAFIWSQIKGPEK